MVGRKKLAFCAGQRMKCPQASRKPQSVTEARSSLGSGMVGEFCLATVKSLMLAKADDVSYFANIRGRR